MKNKYIFLTLLVFALTSCFNLKNEKAVRVLFSLPIGYDINELGVNNFFITEEQKNINFAYSNGFILLSDKVNKKILKLTESGNVLLTIFNNSNYPHLQSNIQEKKIDDTIDNLILFSEFPLENPSLISGDHFKNIYVVDTDESKRKLSKNAIEDRVIHKFNNHGELLFTIGKTGRDTMPFGHINYLSNDNVDNLIVIERTINGYEVHKFSPSGDLITSKILNQQIFPSLKTETSMEKSFITITPSYIEDEIFITIQYTSKQLYMMLETYTIEYEKVFLFSLKTGKIEKMLVKIQPEYIDLTKYARNQKIMDLYGNKKIVPLPLKTICGSNLNNDLYFFQKELPFEQITEQAHVIQKFNEMGRLMMTSRCSYGNDAIFIPSYYITEQGKVLTYIIKEKTVEFVSIQ